METLIEGCSVVAYSGHLMVLSTLPRLVRKSSWYFLFMTQRNNIHHFLLSI